MFSYAGQSTGRGWVFGPNEALDQGQIAQNRVTVGP